MGEFPARGVADGVDGLPGDQHGHDGRLARAGGQFQRQALKLRVGVVVGVVVGAAEMLQKSSSGLPCVRCHFRQPDDSFHRLHLAEERPDAVEKMVAPVLKKPCRFRGDLPVVRIGQGPPTVDMLAQFVDHGCRIV